MIVRAVLDALMNLTLSHTTMSALGCISCLLLSGGMLQHCHREFIFYTTYHPSVLAEP